ncbi:PaaI family thioesterase [Brevundimonas sp.]|uniref:PaaI family thioesterase n=1 Tax=Brevundimonas sp. TaxID=1871086 RepID=UPI00391DE517
MAVPIESLLPQLASGAAHTHALGFQYEALDGESVTLRAPYRDELVGDPVAGVLAGGLVTTMLDHVGGLAVWVALGEFRPIATLDLRVDYMRAAEPGRDLLARSRCYRLTHSIGFVRAFAYESDPDDPVAAAQAAYIINSDGERGVGANVSRPGGPT